MARGGKRGVFRMKWEEAEVLLHALLDDELDAGHARDIETHVATCHRCAAQLRDYRDMRGAFAAVDLRLTAPTDLRRRIDARLRGGATTAICAPPSRPCICVLLPLPICAAASTRDCPRPLP